MPQEKRQGSTGREKNSRKGEGQRNYCISPKEIDHFNRDWIWKNCGHFLNLRSFIRRRSPRWLKRLQKPEEHVEYDPPTPNLKRFLSWFVDCQTTLTFRGVRLSKTCRVSRHKDEVWLGIFPLHLFRLSGKNNLEFSRGTGSTTLLVVCLMSKMAGWG